jgi:ABC-type uncharacterized transport system permease subunit
MSGIKKKISMYESNGNIALKTTNAARRSLFSRTVSAFVSAFAASMAGKYEDTSFAAPLNAISHILWGDKAAHKDDLSIKYTLTGFMLNHAASIFWAFLYEKLFGKQPGKQSAAVHPNAAAEKSSLMKSILGAAAVTVGAYFIDYHLIPKRFTPGYEKRLSGGSLATVFVIMAIGLAARDVIDTTKSKKKKLR